MGPKQTTPFTRAESNDILDRAGISILQFQVFSNHVWHCEYCSEGSEAIFGFTAEELMQDPSLWRSRIIAEDMDTVLAPTFDEIYAGRPSTCTYRFLHRDGDIRWVTTTFNSHQEVEQRWTVIASSLDMTHCKSASREHDAGGHQRMQELNADLEQQVRQRTQQLELAIDAELALKRIADRMRDSLDEAQILQTAVDELGAVLGLISCNAAMYDLEQRTSTVCYEYNPPIIPMKGQISYLSSYPEVYERVLEGKSLQFCNLQLNPIRGRKAMLVCPIIDDQNILGDLWLISDAEHVYQDWEVRLLEQVANQCAIALRQSRLYQAAQAQVSELERLNRLKDDFLSTVSHELRTPISNIKMATQMLEIQLTQQGILNHSDSPTNRYFQILKEECHRETRLINDLLDLTRLDAATDPILLTPIHLQVLIPHIAEPFVEKARSHSQNLIVDVATDLPLVNADISYLERILSELLNNACKYTPAREVIGITARRDQEFVHIEVSNTGVEIPAVECDRIFDRFYRIPSADPWRQGGTGLGLALVKKLIQRLGGSIHINSSNRTTRFWICLPLEQ